LIIGIMFTVMSRFFSPASKVKIYSEICVNTVFWKVKNFVNNAVTGKSVYVASAWWRITPDAYHIIIHTWTNSIDLWYSTWSAAVSIFDTLFLSGDESVDNCQSSKHQVLVSWNINHMVLNRNLQATAGQRWFYFSWQNWVFTGDVSFILDQWNLVQEVYKITIDTRTQSVIRNKCIFLPREGECKEWSD